MTETSLHCNALHCWESITKPPLCCNALHCWAPDTKQRHQSVQLPQEGREVDKEETAEDDNIEEKSETKYNKDYSKYHKDN